MVPGVCRIRPPITGTMGACTASMRVVDFRIGVIKSMPNIIVVVFGGLMIRRRTLLPAFGLALLSTFVATAAGTLQTPEQFLGFKVGADNKLIRWDKIVDYMKLAAANSDRVRFRELGKTSDN